MEVVDGVTVEELLKTCDSEFERVISIAAQRGDGLAAEHEAGITAI